MKSYPSFNSIVDTRRRTVGQFISLDEKRPQMVCWLARQGSNLGCGSQSPVCFLLHHAPICNKAHFSFVGFEPTKNFLQAKFYYPFFLKIAVCAFMYFALAGRGYMVSEPASANSLPVSILYCLRSFLTILEFSLGLDSRRGIRF